MVTESEDMEEKKTPVFLQQTWARPYVVSMSRFLKENGDGRGGGQSVPGGAHLSIWNRGHLFSPPR